MSDRPQLSLGKPPETLHKKLSTVPRGWLVLIVLLNLAALGCLGVLLRNKPPAVSPATPSSSGSAAELKAVAADLEDKSLDAEAARAWEAYLAADPQCSHRAEILYRIGRLHMQAEQFAPAAAALVRCEHAAGDDSDLKAKIGPQLVECFNRLGRYGEMGRELSRRVEVGAQPQPAGEKPAKRVLATIRGQEFTESDLDRAIERRVDNVLAMQGGDPQQRQAILQQMAAPAVRQQLLQEMVKTELFCRRARELNMDRQDDFQQARDQLLQNLLAERFLMWELGKIRATEVDLESYFKANQARYEVPEAIHAVVIRLEDKEDPAAVLEKIKSAEEFRQLAAKRRPADAGQKAASRPIARGQADPELGDAEPLFALAEGQWTKQAHTRDKDRFLVLVDKKVPRQTPRLQDVLSQVQRDYTSRKQKELGEKLFADLAQRYDVRILPDSPAATAEKPGPGKEPPAKKGSAATR